MISRINIAPTISNGPIDDISPFYVLRLWAKDRYRNPFIGDEGASLILQSDSSLFLSIAYFEGQYCRPSCLHLNAKSGSILSSVDNSVRKKELQ